MVRTREQADERILQAIRDGELDDHDIRLIALMFDGLKRANTDHVTGGCLEAAAAFIEATPTTKV